MKKALMVGVFVLVLAAMGGGLWFFGRPAYRNHREATAAARATECLRTGRYNDASLSARQALAYNPANLQACVVMARLCERAQAAQLLDWRRRIAQIAPTLENKLAVVAAAMQTQPAPFTMARQMLHDLAPAATNSVEYHALAAQLALRLDDGEAAAEHFEWACRLKPESEQLRLNLAVLRLSSTNDAVAAAARQTLISLRSSTNLASLALRWLVSDCMKQKQFEGAEQLCRELLSSAGSVFEDRLLHLSILQSFQAPSFANSLAEVQAQAATNSSAIYVTVAWMINNKMTEAAAQWISNCPPQIRTEQLVSRALAECYAARKDWPGLEEFLQGQAWSENDFLRLGFLSLAADRQKQSVAAQVRWRTAIREAGERLGPLMLLLRLSKAWEVEAATEELLWSILQRFPAERWTLAELERSYTRSGNTRGLYKVYTALARYDSRDFAVKNNVASTALLLGMNLPRAHEQALEVYQEHPDNPVAASTYALSLHLQGKHLEALKAMEGVASDGLEKPPVCLYYGVMLAAAGQREKADKYLKASGTGKLLPEERALLAEALGP